MKLSTLIAADDTAVLSPEHGAVDIAGLTADSRKSSQDFCSRRSPAPRPTAAGFIADAVSKGAAAVVVAETAEVPGWAFRAGDPRQGAAQDAGADGGEVLRASTRDHRRRDRDERQDVGRRFHAADIHGAGPAGARLSAPSASSKPDRRRLRIADDARPGDAAPDAERVLRARA